MLQCDVVALTKGTANGDPCQASNQSSYGTDTVGNALDDLNISDGFDVPVDFSTLVTELSGGPGVAEPVAVQIDFGNNAVHFIAICGVHTDVEHVCIADPRYGGDPVEFAFADLNDYGYQNQQPSDGGTGVAQNFQKVTRRRLAARPHAPTT